MNATSESKAGPVSVQLIPPHRSIFKPSNYSVRVPHEMDAELVRRAGALGCSISTFFNLLLARNIEGSPGGKCDECHHRLTVLSWQRQWAKNSMTI